VSVQAKLFDIESQLVKVRHRIAAACDAAGRTVDEVQLLAVSKTKPLADIEIAITAGHRHFGENYLQEALTKIEILGAQPNWHFIGSIQSNKTRLIAENFHWVHTVSSLKIARRLNQQRPENLPPLKIFLQVNIDRDPDKSGLSPEELSNVVSELAGYTRLELMGLMTIPKQRNGFEAQREPFRALRELQKRVMPGQSQLSMGMSGDLEAAIQEGATWVRIGTDIFGARDKP
jgi:pyridoxal phosphate enzyme (YggS family)